MKKFAYVDAIRGIAVLGVLLVHCAYNGTNNFSELASYILSNGARGVQLFFVASSFTLFLSLTYRSGNEKNSTLNFFIRRVFRIAPMFYIGIIYYFCQNALRSNITTANIITHIFFIHGINPYWINSVVPGGWSITVEMMFYCLVPLLFLKIKNLNTSIIFFLTTIILRVLLGITLNKSNIITDTKLWKDFLFYYLPNQLPVFACGIIMFFIITTPKTEWEVKPAVLLVFAIFFLMQLITGTNTLFPPHILFSIAFIILGFALSKKPFKLFVNKFTVYIGKVSYSMYLVHFAVFYWLTKLNWIDPLPKGISHFNLLNFGVRFVLLLVVTIIISTVFYHLVEVPFQRLGKVFIEKKNHLFQSQMRLQDQDFKKYP